MSDVFISYSRKNLEFVETLVSSLEAVGKTVWWDQKKEPLEGITVGSTWWEQITLGIEDTDTFLFIISPNSITSPYCHAEINHARQHRKRVVPVLYCGWTSEPETRDAVSKALVAISDEEEMVDSITDSNLNLKKLAHENWLAISKIQYVAFSSSSAYEQSFEQLSHSYHYLAQIEGDFEKGIDQGSHDALTMIARAARAAVLHG